MKADTYWKAIQRRQLSRRRLLSAGAASAGLTGLILSGCATGSRSAREPGGAAATQQGTTGQPQTGGTFNTYIPINPTSLDAQATKSIQARTVTGGVMSRLFRHKTDANPATALSLQMENDLAISAESPDALTWTVRLRPDTKFQNVTPINGRPVEAEDVRASYVRAITLPQSAARSYILMVDPDQIQTPAKDTVVFKLKSPYGPFLQTMGNVTAGWIYPREVATGAYDPAKRVIGSGPFMFDSYTPDVAVTAKKNPDWFEKGRPYVDGIRTSIIPAPAQQLAQLTAGNLDELLTDVNNIDAAKRSNPKASVITAQWPNCYQVFGHMDDPASAFRDIRVRQALSMAIDRAAIAKAVFNGKYHDNGVMTSSLQKSALGPDKLGDASKYYTYNLAEAKRLVEASGAGNRFTKFVYPTQSYGPQFETIAQMLNPMFNAAGFKTELVAVDYASQFINVGKGILYGHYDPDTLVFCIWYSGSGGQGPEETILNALLPGYDSNHSHVDDPTATEMLNKMITIADENQRFAAVQDIQRYAADKIYYISSIPTGDTYTMVQPRVKNYAPSLNIDVEDTETCSKLWLTS